MGSLLQWIRDLRARGDSDRCQRVMVGKRAVLLTPQQAQRYKELQRLDRRRS